MKSTLCICVCGQLLLTISSFSFFLEMKHCWTLPITKHLIFCWTHIKKSTTLYPRSISTYIFLCQHHKQHSGTFKKLNYFRQNRFIFRVLLAKVFEFRSHSFFEILPYVLQASISWRIYSWSTPIHKINEFYLFRDLKLSNRRAHEVWVRFILFADRQICALSTRTTKFTI